MKVFVFHAPEAVPTQDFPQCAIAVDVLRATSTIATALVSGAEGVQAFSDLQTLLTVSEDWDPEKRIRIGERGGRTVEGFDLGNSPLDCTPSRVKDSRIFISTTNGTRALSVIQQAQTVLTAAFLNRAAVAQHLHKEQPETVWIVASGWEGSFSLEDTACAGAVIDHLITLGEVTLDDIAGNDEAIAAVTLYRQFQDNLVDLLTHASHGKRLLGLGLYEDLQYCARLDVLDVVPFRQEEGILRRYAIPAALSA